MLYIYSGNVPELDDKLASQITKNGKLLIIPASPSDHSSARHVASYYSYCGINAQTLPVKAYTNKELLKKRILESAALYLCGGNTYEFLDFAQKMELFPTLSILEANGGIIAAESAGSIILSDDISTAAVPSSCPDENSIGIKHLDAMGRIPFHISPHFDPQDEFCDSDIAELQALADSSNQAVLLLQDGEGFIMQDRKITFFQGTEKYLLPTRQSITDKKPEPA